MVFVYGRHSQNIRSHKANILADVVENIRFFIFNVFSFTSIVEMDDHFNSKNHCLRQVITRVVVINERKHNCELDIHLYGHVY